MTFFFIIILLLESGRTHLSINLSYLFYVILFFKYLLKSILIKTKNNLNYPILILPTNQILKFNLIKNLVFNPPNFKKL